MSRTRVFIASSLDGFIAGPNDELDWLPTDHAGAKQAFDEFFAHIGALLMGRGTYDVVCGFEGPWFYGDTPVLVATNRAMEAKHPTVRAVKGSIGEMVAEARRVAGDRDVYIDGGGLIRAALDANLVDEITVTMIPMVLGAGRPLFAGTTRRHALELLRMHDLGGGLVTLVYRPTAGR